MFFLFDFLKNCLLYYIVDKLLSDFSRFVSYYTMNIEVFLLMFLKIMDEKS